MGWQGHVEAVGELADRIADLGGMPARVTARIADGLAKLVRDEFDGGHDPYGMSWAPLAASTQERGRTAPPLTDTGAVPPGAMRSSVKAAPDGPSRVVLTIAHPAAPHQTGWSGARSSGPARELVPTGDMPPEWDATIREAVGAELARRAHR